jgi:hypothetical protein
MTMRKSILSATAIAAITIATPALAQTSTGTVTVNGSVANRCLFTTASETINANELALGGSGTTAGKLDVSKLNGQSRTLVGWCNATASTMTVEAQPVVNTSFTSAPPAGFDRIVNYTATATANAIPATDTSVTAGAGTAATVGLFTGNVTVALSASSTPTSGLLVAGTYAGQVIVTLAPATALPPV